MEAAEVDASLKLVAMKKPHLCCCDENVAGNYGNQDKVGWELILLVGDGV
jgi:hypothetical protein